MPKRPSRVGGSCCFCNSLKPYTDQLRPHSVGGRVNSFGDELTSCLSHVKTCYFFSCWFHADSYRLSILVQVLVEVARSLGVKCHVRGTMLSIEGPRFSSRAESLMFRQWGADVINMTTVPEVVLAKEAGLCYASIAMATDYDCWKEHEEAVSGWLKVLTVVFIVLMSPLCLFVSCVSLCGQRMKHWWCTGRHHILSQCVYF